MLVIKKICVPVSLYYALKKRGLYDCDRARHEKNKKKMKKSVDRRTPAIHTADMSGPHGKDKKRVTFWVQIELFKKFQKRAKSLGMTMTEIMTAFLLQQTKNIELTAEEYEQITEEIRKKTNNY